MFFLKELHFSHFTRLLQGVIKCIKKSKKKFFIPVKVLSRKFRGKFLYHLNELYLKNKLKFPRNISELSVRNIFNSFKDDLYKKEWIVYSKAPFSSAEYVLQYLGRYTH
ncbi:hypothetical protein GKZ28_17795, partial [Clostridium chromiireducens]|nr:hypothetical protein [Clostridium chromiireducens]